MNSDRYIEIITDSTADLADRFRDRVKTVPLTVSFGEQEYLDGIELSRMDFTAGWKN